MLNSLLHCAACVQYDDIPVEVSGHECPDPMLAFDPAVLGEALMRNLSLARYEKPTPVQKYSIPIGTLPAISSW